MCTAEWYPISKNTSALESVDLSRSASGLPTRNTQHHGVEQQHPLLAVRVAPEVLPRPAERDLGVLPEFDQLAGHEDEGARHGRLKTARDSIPPRSKRAPLKFPQSRTAPELTIWTTVAMTSASLGA